LKLTHHKDVKVVNWVYIVSHTLDFQHKNRSKWRFKLSKEYKVQTPQSLSVLADLWKDGGSRRQNRNR
jgi:hypothetical protein